MMILCHILSTVLLCIAMLSSVLAQPADDMKGSMRIARSPRFHKHHGGILGFLGGGYPHQPSPAYHHPGGHGGGGFAGSAAQSQAGAGGGFGHGGGGAQAQAQSQSIAFGFGPFSGALSQSQAQAQAQARRRDFDDYYDY